MDASGFASLRSLADILETIKLRNSNGLPPRFDEQQIDDFEDMVLYLLKFLEDLSPGACRRLEVEASISKIPEIVFTAKNTIDFHVVDQLMMDKHYIIPRGVFSFSETERTIDTLYTRVSSFRQALVPVMEKMKEIILDLDETSQEYLTLSSSFSDIRTISGNLERKIPAVESSVILGFRDYVDYLKNELFSHEKYTRVVAICGMVGIGKTTLARTIFYDRSVNQRFDKLLWISASPSSDVRSILQKLLRDKVTNEIGELGDKLYRSLWGQRYLLVVDDFWNIHQFEELKLFLPYSDQRSRVIITFTTRVSSIMPSLGPSAKVLKMEPLSYDLSWELLCGKTFGHSNGCPKNLEKIGRDITKSCKGNPSCVVSIAGLLSKSEYTTKYWDYVAKNLSSLVRVEDGGHCRKILLFCYENMPLHLKACLLCMGIYKEDAAIDVQSLFNMWVREGILKPIGGIAIEDTSKEYLNDLIDRNMVFVEEYDSVSNDPKSVKMQHLMHEEYLIELQKNKLFINPSLHRWEGKECLKCGGIYEIQNYSYELAMHSVDKTEFCLGSIIHWVRDLHVSRGMSCPRCRGENQHTTYFLSSRQISDSPWNCCNNNSQDFHFHSTNLEHKLSGLGGLPLFLFWNTSMLRSGISRYGISYLPQLQQFSGSFLSMKEPIIFTNLWKIECVELKCTRELIESTPNLKVLHVGYPRWTCGNISSYCLENIEHWSGLQELRICGLPLDNIKIRYPPSLLTLGLERCYFYWTSHTRFMATWLHNLEKLILNGCDVGDEWNVRYVQFGRLKYLEIQAFNDKYPTEWRWKVHELNFPMLRSLHVRDELNLRGIPLYMGNICTLEYIFIRHCCDRVLESAKQIIRYQREEGNDDLKLYIYDGYVDKLFEYEDKDFEEENYFGELEEEDFEELDEEDLEENLCDIDVYNLKLIPESLGILTLLRCSLTWTREQYVTAKMSKLKRLILKECEFESQWKTGVEWTQLQYFEITNSNCRTHVRWQWCEKASSFPKLQTLRIMRECHLKEIPLDVINIATLDQIVLVRCSKGLVNSAKKIVNGKDEGTPRLIIEGLYEDYDMAIPFLLEEKVEEEDKLLFIDDDTFWNSSKNRADIPLILEEEVEEEDKLLVIDDDKLWSTEKLFPYSLEVLILLQCSFQWTHIATLSSIQKLILKECEFGSEWKLGEFKFLQLLYLEITNSNCRRCRDHEWEWHGRASNFPRLENIEIIWEYQLKEIPLDMANIATLVHIRLVDCSRGIIESAKRIFRGKGENALRLVIDRIDYKEDIKHKQEEEDEEDDFSLDLEGIEMDDECGFSD